MAGCPGMNLVWLLRLRFWTDVEIFSNKISSNCCSISFNRRAEVWSGMESQEICYAKEKLIEVNWK